MNDKRNWEEIEAAYVTGGGSYRELTARFSVPYGTLQKRGTRGGWVEKRKNHEERKMEEILKADTMRALERTERLLKVGDGLLDKVQELTAATESPAALKTLTEALKNIRDAQMLKEGSKAEGNKITVVLENVGEFAA